MQIILGSSCLVGFLPSRWFGGGLLDPVGVLKFARIECLSWARFGFRQFSSESVGVLLPDLCFELRVVVLCV